MTRKQYYEYTLAHPEEFPAHEECSCKWTGGGARVDKNMVDIISTLNEKGYRTEACCEGDEKGPGVMRMFILFAECYDFAIPIPSQFYASIFRKKQISIHLDGKDLEKIFLKKFPDCSESVEYKGTALKTLRDWSQKLPYILTEEEMEERKAKVENKQWKNYNLEW